MIMRIVLFCIAIYIAFPVAAQGDSRTISATSSATQDAAIAARIRDLMDAFCPNDSVEINGNHIRIPNATVFKSRIANYTQHAERRVVFLMAVDRDTDLSTSRELIEKTAQDLPFVLSEPVASVGVESFEPTGVEIVVTGWVN